MGSNDRFSSPRGDHYDPIMSTPLLETPAEERHAARLAVAARAHDADDARLLLDALGLS